MPKVHLFIGHTSTEAVSVDQPVLIMLPETVRPAAVPTYVGQLYERVKVLVKLGNEKNIFTTHFLPYIGVVKDNVLAAKKRELDSLQAKVDQFSGDTSKRASVFINYLFANHLIDRKLYPVLEKIRSKASLTNKDLSPLVDSVYVSLRKTAGATSAQKQKIRAYIQSGEYDISLIEWLSHVVDPGFGMFQVSNSLGREVQELESRNRLVADPALARDFCTAVGQLATGKSNKWEVHGINVERWLEELVGCKVQSSFFAEIRKIQEGLSKNGCLLLQSPKHIKELNDPALTPISLEKFSCIVTALDRTLSVIVVQYAKEDPDVQSLLEGRAVHSGLLIRAFLGETDAIRTLYPKHVVGILGKPELDEILIAKTRRAFEDGLMARFCSKYYGLEEYTLAIGIEKAVAIQQKILPLLPFEIHRLVDVLETRIRLRQMVKKFESSGGQSLNQAQFRNLRANLNAQNLRGQQITKRLKADFRIDLSKMFCLDEALMDELEYLFGSELGFLRPVLADYIQRGETDSGSALEQGNEAGVH